jgi:hypothetical protein
VMGATGDGGATGVGAGATGARVTWGGRLVVGLVVGPTGAFVALCFAVGDGVGGGGGRSLLGDSVGTFAKEDT